MQACEEKGEIEIDVRGLTKRPRKLAPMLPFRLRLVGGEGAAKYYVPADPFSFNHSISPESTPEPPLVPALARRICRVFSCASPSVQPHPIRTTTPFWRHSKAPKLPGLPFSWPVPKLRDATWQSSTGHIVIVGGHTGGLADWLGAGASWQATAGASQLGERFEVAGSRMRESGGGSRSLQIQTL